MWVFLCASWTQVNNREKYRANKVDLKENVNGFVIKLGKKNCGAASLNV